MNGTHTHTHTTIHPMSYEKHTKKIMSVCVRDPSNELSLSLTHTQTQTKRCSSLLLFVHMVSVILSSKITLPFIFKSIIISSSENPLSSDITNRLKLVWVHLLSH
jgi:hypothetical protein